MSSGANLSELAAANSSSSTPGQGQQWHQQHQQHLLDSDHTEALAPVDVTSNRFGVEAPLYESPRNSRQSLRPAAEVEPAVELKRSHQTAEQRRHQNTESTTVGASPTTTLIMQQQQQSGRVTHQVAHQQAEEAPQGSRCCEYLLMFLSGLLIVLTFPFSLCVCIKIVQQYERAVIFRLGRVQGAAKGPGLFFLITCIDKMHTVDLRTVTFDVPPQEILTKDSVTVAVDAVVYYRIFDPIKATIDIEDVHRATRLLAQTTLRNILGTKTLHEILGEREIIAHAMQGNLDVATDPWGVKVERVEVKDVRLPVQMQRAMAAEAEALREAKAKVIAAEGEQKASRALKEAADVINESPAALQLRYLQTLNTIAAEKNSTIIFPLPIELMNAVMKR